MAKPSTSAGDLVEKVAFSSPQSGSDGAGGRLAGFDEQFKRRAAFVHLRGGEAVLAARLEGRHSMVVRTRTDSDTSTVTTDWRITDSRTSTVYEVKDVTPGRHWTDFLVQSGVAG